MVPSLGSNLYKCTEQKWYKDFDGMAYKRSNLYKCTEQKNAYISVLDESLEAICTSARSRSMFPVISRT